MPDNLCNPSLRLFPAAAVRRKLCHHLMAVHRAFCPLRRHEDVRRDLLAVRNDKSVAVTRFYPVKPHHLRDASGCNPYNLPFPFLLFLFLYDYDFYCIAVKRSSCMIFPDKHIRQPALNLHKAESSRIGAKNAGKFSRLSPHILSSFGQANLSLPFKSLQYLSQLVLFFPRNLQDNGKLLEFHRRIQIVTHEIIDYLLSLFKCSIHSLHLPFRIIFHTYPCCANREFPTAENPAYPA